MSQTQTYSACWQANFAAMFGSRLAQALDEHAQKTRKWLAKEVGVTESAITMVINGQAKAMNAANCARAARALGVHCLWLATGEGPMADTATQLLRDVAHKLATTLDTAERGQRYALFRIADQPSSPHQAGFFVAER